MSVFLLSFVLFILLAGALGLRDLSYARHLARNSKTTELLP
jgi:hypothetical protein